MHRLTGVLSELNDLQKLNEQIEQNEQSDQRDAALRSSAIYSVSSFLNPHSFKARIALDFAGKRSFQNHVRPTSTPAGTGTGVSSHSFSIPRSVKLRYASLLQHVKLPETPQNTTQSRDSRSKTPWSSLWTVLQRWKSRRSLRSRRSRQAPSDSALDAALRLADAKTAEIAELDTVYPSIPAGEESAEPNSNSNSNSNEATLAWIDRLLAWSDEADDAVIVRIRWTFHAGRIDFRGETPRGGAGVRGASRELGDGSAAAAVGGRRAGHFLGASALRGAAGGVGERGGALGDERRVLPGPLRGSSGDGAADYRGGAAAGRVDRAVDAAAAVDARRGAALFAAGRGGRRGQTRGL